MPELDVFLKAAKDHGATDEFLVDLLREKGWPVSEIYAALGRHYAAATGIDVPAAPSRLESAREAFFHLLAFATLAAWIFSAGSLWFELIDTWFPDATVTTNQDWRWSRVSWQMAAIIVAFPAFVFATRAILAEMERNPDKAVSAVRRWLTNIALLITALVFIGDLVAFVASFLQGELTSRFTLKCLTVFLLAGAVFLYYSRNTGSGAVPPRLWNRAFALGAAALILLSIGFGFMKAGSPLNRRAQAEDRRRVLDLYQIAVNMNTRWNEQKLPPAERMIPLTLAELPAGTGGTLQLNDPFSKAPYEYTVVSSSAYRLCATFDTATAVESDQGRTAWRHAAGRACFDLDASRAPSYPGSFR